MVCCLLLAVGCDHGSAQRRKGGGNSDGVTDIAIGTTVIQTGVKRLGINIGGQNFYDSGQMLRDLTFSNPGFEGGTWQSILRCKVATATSCRDSNQWALWPANFLEGAQIEVISGAAVGSAGMVTSSLPADAKVADQGVTISFAPLSRAMHAGDFLVVRKAMPGDAQAGWWTNASGGATFSTEFHDLSPETGGKQALRVSASAAGQSASVSSYFDSMAGHSFVQLKGPYRVSFRAKGIAGSKQLRISLGRQAEHSPAFLSKDVHLTDQWRSYNLDLTAAEDGSKTGTLALTFDVSGTEVLLDDVSLTSTRRVASNPTAFRDEVVDTLRELRPGILRYNDGDHLGSSIDNLIAAPYARVRAGFTEEAIEQRAVPLGLHEFLQLCQTVGAEPWFVMPPGMSLSEMRSLTEYLAGSPATAYGAKRAALGQAAPWTTVFPVVHLELGNEEWNGATFPGAAMPDATAYGQRAKEIFMAARSVPGYLPDRFDLVIGSFNLIPDWTRQELANSGGYDSTAVAPYLFSRLDDAGTNEAVFGPMFAEPEMVDSRPAGYMAQQAKVARAAAKPATLSVYEVNVGTTSGKVRQAAVDNTIPSLGAGLTVVDHMLLMLRDLGIKNQMVWALPGYSNSFKNSVDSAAETTPVFGVVVDMGGATNLRRPHYCAEELANKAILATMLKTTHTGTDPTWNQPLSVNGDIRLEGAHEVQTFAFGEGLRRSLIVLNLSRTDPHSLTFSGSGAPFGRVEVSQLTSKYITDSNEKMNVVGVATSELPNFVTKTPYRVPPFSMTVLQWTASH